MKTMTMVIYRQIEQFYREKLLPIIRDPLQRSRWDRPYFYNNREANQLSVRVSGRAYREEPFIHEGGFYVHPFIQDMYADVMPYLNWGSTADKCSVALEPTDETLEQLVATGLGKERYRSNLPQAVCDFVRDAAQSVLTYGSATYEVVYEKSNCGHVTRLKFVDIHPYSIKKFLGNYYQIITWRIAKILHLKVGVIRIPKEKILHLEMPKELGGRRRFRKTLQRLWKLGKTTIPEFYLETWKNGEDVGFDLGKYSHDKYIEVAYHTRKFGWNQRKNSDNEILEYYDLHRYMKKKMALCIIRENIIEAINKSLNGSLLNLNASIRLSENLRQPYLEAQLKVLERGNINFTEIINSITI